MMSLMAHFGFLFCVAVATFAQNTTGFAFGLLLLGLTGLLQLSSVEVVANVSSVLTLVNALFMLRRKPQLSSALMLVILFCSLMGVLFGVVLLEILGTQARNGLQLLLGTSIILCSFLLLIRTQPMQKQSNWLTFSGFAGLSGIMGGLFSSAGPPLVYHLYRQPLAAQTVRDTLILVFAVNALLRIGLMTHASRFEIEAVYLALEATPIVLLMTWYMRRYPPKINAKTMRIGVFFLLLLAGLSLVIKPILLFYAKFNPFF